jgi:hypothetical protein
LLRADAQMYPFADRNQFGGNRHRDRVDDYDFEAGTRGAVTFGTINDFYNGVIGSPGGFGENFLLNGTSTSTCTN